MTKGFGIEFWERLKESAEEAIDRNFEERVCLEVFLKVLRERRLDRLKELFEYRLKELDGDDGLSLHEIKECDKQLHHFKNARHN